jgi:hypothetical protein
MSKRFLSVILAICIGLTAIAIIQIKPWQQGRSPAILSSETQDQGSLNPQPIDPAASEPSSEQEPGIAAADEAPEENPSVPTEQKTPLGQPDDVTSPVEPLLPARPGSGAVKLSTGFSPSVLKQMEAPPRGDTVAGRIPAGRTSYTLPG